MYVRVYLCIHVYIYIGDALQTVRDQVSLLYKYTHTHTQSQTTEAESSREKPSPQSASLKAPEGRPRRKTVESKDVYKPPLNPYLEEEEGEEPQPPSPTVSPTEEWLGDSPIIDCFDEAQSRNKLDNADVIGVSLETLGA